MPAADYDDSVDDRDGDGKGKGGSSKSKDLSHVPCKFYKVGSCTAGSSCPFSHSAQETGGQKETCAWFVKGNCKFGHKCALAHILPGQSMAMDRKNKKAAQQAASGGGGGKGGRGNGRRDMTRNPLLASGSGGRGAPGRPPINIPTKARASAPAPGLKDTDFASFGVLDDLEEREKKPAESPSTTPKNEQPPTDPSIEVEKAAETESASKSKSASPVSLPMSSRKTTSQSPYNPPLDFGPIGSPPRGAAVSPSHRAHAISPGASPSQRTPNGMLSASPFSAPGAHSMHMLDEHANRGMTASLGTNLNMGSGFGRRSGFGMTSSQIPESNLSRKVLEEDGDMEDFIPSSLTDLLTPEERSRRMSRSNSGQGGTPLTAGHLAEQMQLGGLPGSMGSASGHRYSRSVPAPTLLGDMSAIWAESNNKQHNVGLAASPHRNIGNGAPSSFTSNSAFGGRSLVEEQHILNPSNASAAFLPGNMHQHLGPKQGFASNLGRGIRENGQMGQRSTSGIVPRASYASQNARHTPLQPEIQVDDPSLMSPGARALQAHAPGESLPQGLAAGYSRIHALPALPPLPSPSSIGGFSVSPGPSNMFAQGPYGTNLTGHDWNTQQNTGTSPAGTDRLDAMFSKLSYSAAASQQRMPTGPPPGIQRNVSGGGRWGPGPGPAPTPLSPLSGPVVTGDDDDLFTLDG